MIADPEHDDFCGPRDALDVHERTDARYGTQPAEEQLFGEDDYVRAIDADDPESPQTRAAGGDFTGAGEEALTVGHPMFERLDEWVNQWLVPMFVRPVTGNNVAWCPKWWLHAEAYLRLDALWRCWEYLRWQPAIGMSVFTLDHLDRHMAVLMSPGGPFSACKAHRHADVPERPMPTVIMPTDEEIEAAYAAAARGLGLETLRGRHGEIPA